MSKELHDGVLVERSGGGFYQVQLETRENPVRCYLAGKMKHHKIKVIEGDKVQIWWTPKQTIGRIVKRY